MDKQEKYYAPFPSNLRALLDERGKTITALANELGISRQAVSQYTDGTGQPNAEKLRRIADYFNVSTDWLLGRSGGVKALDPDKQSAAEYTGLSETAISWLHSIKDDPNVDYLRIISAILEDKTFREILPEIPNLEQVKLSVDLDRFGVLAPVKERWTGEGYLVGAYDYFDMLEFRIAQELKLVISNITDPQIEEQEEK